MIHAVVIHPRYLDLVLSGEKDIESRLSVNRVEPFGVVRVGERLYFKARGGAFGATALVARVNFYEGLTPRAVEGLRRQWNGRVRGELSYWRSKRRARFATLIELSAVEPVAFGPTTPPFHGRAWRMLPQRHDVYPACVAGTGVGVSGVNRARAGGAAVGGVKR